MPVIEPYTSLRCSFDVAGQDERWHVIIPVLTQLKDDPQIHAMTEAQAWALALRQFPYAVMTIVNVAHEEGRPDGPNG